MSSCARCISFPVRCGQSFEFHDVGARIIYNPQKQRRLQRMVPGALRHKSLQSQKHVPLLHVTPLVRSRTSSASSPASLLTAVTARLMVGHGGLGTVAEARIEKPRVARVCAQAGVSLLRALPPKQGFLSHDVAQGLCHRREVWPILWVLQPIKGLVSSSLLMGWDAT